MKILYVTRHYNHSGYIILHRLIEEGFDIVGILLKDEYRFRNTRLVNLIERAKYKIECSYYRAQPLKTLDSEELLAKSQNIRVIRTKSIKSDSFYNDLKKLNPDIIVLGGGWPELIPERVFSFPKLGCINTHPSLLPKFKGTSITRWQILHGVRKSGSTIHYVNEKFDEGEIVAQKSCLVTPEYTPQELFYKLGRLGADLMVDTLNRIRKMGYLKTLKTETHKQQYEYYSKWKWEFEKLKIDWSKPMRNIHFFVKACTQESYKYLGPIAVYKEKRYFIRVTKLSERSLSRIPQTNKLVITSRSKKTISVSRSGDSNELEIVKMQRFSKYYFLRRAKDAAKVISEVQGETLELT